MSYYGTQGQAGQQYGSQQTGGRPDYGTGTTKGGYPPPPPQQGYPSAPRPGPRPPQTDEIYAGMPPGADPNLWYWFRTVDLDRSGHISGAELQQALINGDMSAFNPETIRLMMNLFDKNHTGTIDFREFSGLWRYISEWRQCFRGFDADGSGTIDKKELRSALLAFGYNISENMVDLLIRKYDRYGKSETPKEASDGHGTITFDNFIQCCVTIRSLTDAFKRYDEDRDGVVRIDYETFLALVLANR